MISNNQLTARGISPGFALGSALVLRPLDLKYEPITKLDCNTEMARFEVACGKTKARLEALFSKTLKNLGPDAAAIFEAHIMVLEDPELKDATKDRIAKESLTAEYALTQVSAEVVKVLENIDDDYLRERAHDIKDITRQLMVFLSGQDDVDLAELTRPVILVSHDITPSQMASLNKEMVLGMVTEIGGKSSHTAILARNMEIPAVSGARDATSKIKSGDRLFLQGSSGELLLNPSDEIQRKFVADKEKEKAEKQQLLQFKNRKSQTQDGHTIFIEANIGSPGDTPLIERYGAEGVGLFRTEFIFMDRTKAPSEDEQFEIYKKVLTANPEHNIIIRTLDIGGDKEIAYLQIEKEMNPFLGLRAVRYCLKHKNIFKTQLRAMLRASAFGKLGIMIPMISNREEVRNSRMLLEECRQERLGAGIKVAEGIKVGIMIETPAAAVIADVLAKEVDFFSLGTNDLIQYVCAVDRLNEEVQDLYEPYHPAVIRLIHQTAAAAKQAGIQVGICGDLAAHTGLLPVFIGFGIDHLSMSPSSVLKTRSCLSKLKLSDCKTLAEKVLLAGSASELRAMCEKP